MDQIKEKFGVATFCIQGVKEAAWNRYGKTSTDMSETQINDDENKVR